MARSPAARCAAAAVVAALLLAAARPGAAAAAAATKRGFKGADEQALYADVLKGLGVWSDAVVKNKKLPDVPPAPAATASTAGPAVRARGVAAAAAAVTTKSAASAAGAGASAAAVVPKAAATSGTVARAIGRVLAAASLEAEVQSTLGAPDKFKYTDGSGRHALYRLPPGTAKGTCILIHGCKHDPESWFYRSDKCPACTGLPEEVAHTKQCLARGYAVLALMSKDRLYRRRCFSSSGNPALSDHASAKALIQAWVAGPGRRSGLASKPKFMFGVSAGASFAIKFVRTMYLEGVVSEVNMPWADAWGAVRPDGTLEYRHPPTAFYQMARDTETANQIAAALKIFKNNNVPAATIKSPVRQVTPDFFHNRSLYISKAQSAELVVALKKVGLLDRNGWIKMDPRMNRQWTTDLPKVLKWVTRDSPYHNVISDESQVWQELNMAYSQHEIVGDYVRPTLMWLESKGKKDLGRLVRDFSTGDSLRCLTEAAEGCPKGAGRAGRRRSRAMLLK